MTVLTKAAVRQLLLAGPAIKGWSLQGFGMLRLYLDARCEYRLHVWDARYAVKDVSAAHDHPWDFESTIIAGELVNQLFIEQPDHLPGGSPFLEQKLLCGLGGGLCEEKPRALRLIPHPPDRYNEGDTYFQSAAQIHTSQPVDGTVTIIKRIFHEDTEHARVFWRKGVEWVSAEPRPAYDLEVRNICDRALAMWFQ